MEAYARGGLLCERQVGRDCAIVKLGRPTWSRAESVRGIGKRGSRCWSQVHRAEFRLVAEFLVEDEGLWSL